MQRKQNKTEYIGDKRKQLIDKVIVINWMDLLPIHVIIQKLHNMMEKLTHIQQERKQQQQQPKHIQTKHIYGFVFLYRYTKQ